MGNSSHPRRRGLQKIRVVPIMVSFGGFGCWDGFHPAHGNHAVQVYAGRNIVSLSTSSVGYFLNNINPTRLGNSGGCSVRIEAWILNTLNECRDRSAASIATDEFAKGVALRPKVWHLLPGEVYCRRSHNLPALDRSPKLDYSLTKRLPAPNGAFSK